MRAASRWRLAAGAAALVLAAFALRAWGARHGLPYVYNADENSHFVPRAIGMFGHNYNPGYFINPPAFTYVLHALFFARWGTRDAVGDAFARDPTTAFLLARLASAALGALAVGLLVWAGSRLFNRTAGLARRRAAGHRLPAGPLRPLRAQRRAGAGAGVPRPGRRGRASRAAAARATTSSRGWGSGSPARPSTPRASSSCAVLGAAIAARPRPLLRPLALAGRGRGARLPRRQPVRAARPARLRGRAVQAVRDGLGRRRQARPRRREPARLLRAHAHVGLRLDPARRRAGRGRAAGAARSRRRARARPGAARAARLPRRPGPLLRPLDAAGLPDAEPARGGRRGGGGDVARTADRVAARDGAGDRGRGAAPVRAGAGLRRPQRPRARARGHAPARAGVDGAPHPGGREDRRRADRARPVGHRRGPALGRDRQRGALDQVPDVALARAQRRHARHALARGQARGLRAHHAAGRSRPLPPRGLLLGGDRIDPVRARAGRARQGAAGDPLLRAAAARGRRGLPRQPVRAGQQAARGSPSTSRSTATRSPSSGRARRCGSTTCPGARGGSALSRLLRCDRPPTDRPCAARSRDRTGRGGAGAREPEPAGRRGRGQGRPRARRGLPRRLRRGARRARGARRLHARTRAAARSTCRWSRAAITAARRRAPTRSSPPASRAWSWRRDDPTEKASGRGLGILRDEGIEVVVADAEPAARARLLNQPFRKHARTGPAARAVQVGDVARRQGRDADRRLQVDLRRGVAAARAPLAGRARRRRGRDRDRAGRRPAAHRAGAGRRAPAAARRVRLRGPAAARLPARPRAPATCR